MVDTSATALVRAGSGLLFSLVGVAILALARGRRANVGLGLWAFGGGVTTVAYNLFFRDAATASFGLLLAGVSYAVATGGAAYYLVASHPLRRLAAASLFGLAFAASLVMPVQMLLPPTPSGSAGLRAVAGVLGAASGTVIAIAVVALASAARASEEASERRRHALLAVVLGVHWSFTSGAALVGPIPFERAGMVFLLGAPAAWLWAATRAGRPAVLAAWALLAGGLLGMVDDVEFGGSTIFGAGLGSALLLTATAGLLVYGVVRLRLLGHDLAVPTARRGSLAAAVLVAFFIVAQIAQEFLSDSMGVVLGGIAAGALLFAAVPLQRAAERLAGGERGVAIAARTSGHPSADAYRDALRLALHDGAMTREEERHLASLADRLGVSYAEALRLRHEVETETGAGR